MLGDEKKTATLTHAQIDALVYFNQARVEQAIIRDDPHRTRDEKLEAYQQLEYSTRSVYVAFNAEPGDYEVEIWLDRYRVPTDRVLGRQHPRNIT